MIDINQSLCNMTYDIKTVKFIPVYFCDLPSELLELRLCISEVFLGQNLIASLVDDGSRII